MIQGEPVSKYLAFLAAGLALSATPAFAQSLTIETPDVLKGRFEIEADNTYLREAVGDDDVFAHRLTVAYAPYENLRFAVGAVANDLVGQGPTVDQYLAEVRFEGPRPSWMPFEWGLQATYLGGGPEGVNDAMELRFLATTDIGPVDIVSNLNLSREVGGGAGEDTHFDLLLEGRLPISEQFIAAITYSGQLGTDEEFGDLGSIGQYLGPTIYASLPVPVANSALGIEAGVLFGLNEESLDTVGKINLTWATQF